MAGTLWVLFVFAALVLSYGVLCRILAGRVSLLLIYFTLTMVAACLLGGWAFLTGLSYFEIFGIIAVFGLLAELYLFLFTLVENSVAVSILMRLRRDQELSFEEVAQSYRVEDMVERRVTRMHAGGLLSVADGCYHLTAKGRGLIRTFEWLAQILGRDHGRGQAT
jgi:hypothetical protein